MFVPQLLSAKVEKGGGGEGESGGGSEGLERGGANCGEIKAMRLSPLKLPLPRAF